MREALHNFRDIIFITHFLAEDIWPRDLDKTASCRVLAFS